MTQILTEKYRPNSLSELEVNSSIVSQLNSFTKKNPKGKALLLYGPPGTGKTSSVYALANDNNYELLEINASDFRDKISIEERLQKAVQQQSLMHKSKIFLVDEIDGLSGNKDRGGISALIHVIKLSNYPIILTTNDLRNKKLDQLRKYCEVVEFKKLDIPTIIKVLKKIAKLEHLNLDEDYIKTVAIASSGDLRSAINDLELFIEGEPILISKKERENSIFNALTAIFKGKYLKEVQESLDNVNINIDEASLWIEENIPYEYKNHEDLRRALECLSKADVFRGRILRQQYWRFLVYYNILITSGVALAKQNDYPGLTNYKRTQKLLKIWRAKKKISEQKKISDRYAIITHISKKRAFKEFPYYMHIIKNNESIRKELGIEE